jgi:integrase
MAKERTGSIVKRKPRTKGEKSSWWARITYIDPVSGKRRDLQRRAESKAHARDLVHSLVNEIDTTEGRSLAHERKTFAELADYYEKHYLKPAEYVEGRKVAGLRSLTSPKGQLQTARGYFGRRPLRSITYADIADFRSERLKTPTRGDLARYDEALKQYEKAPKPRHKVEPPELRVTRSIATANRDLALLRRMLNVAKREGWIISNPFNMGESLISVADEKKRERILTRPEESSLLGACNARRLVHLRPIIVCALANRVITVAAFNTKTMRARTVSVTARLAKELERLYEQSPKHRDGLVFGIRDDVKHSFDTVRRAAGLSDLRFHDLRHTAATRLVGLHIPLSEVGRVLGHTQANTTYRYVNANIETARRAAAALDAFNAEAESGPVTELVN